MVYRSFAGAASVLLLLVPGATASALGVSIADLGLPQPIMPLTAREVYLQGEARCTLEDHEPGTITRINLHVTSAGDWRVQLRRPTFELRLDPSRCADDAYFEPFEIPVLIEPRLGAQPFKENRVTVTAWVSKQPPEPQHSPVGEAVAHLTAVADELVAGEIHPREYAESQWGLVHVYADEPISIPILVENRGTGTIQILVDASPSDPPGVLFELPSSQNLTSPFGPERPEGRAYIDTRVIMPAILLGKTVEFSLTAKAVSTSPPVSDSFNGSIAYRFHVTERPSLLPGFEAAQLVLALLLICCLGIKRGRMRD